MINKEYLKHLKETDPIAYCELINDPVGCDNSFDGCSLAVVIALIFVIISIFIF